MYGETGRRLANVQKAWRARGLYVKQSMRHGCARLD